MSEVDGRWSFSSGWCNGSIEIEGIEWIFWWINGYWVMRDRVGLVVFWGIKGRVWIYESWKRYRKGCVLERKGCSWIWEGDFVIFERIS